MFVCYLSIIQTGSMPIKQKRILLHFLLIMIFFMALTIHAQEPDTLLLPFDIPDNGELDKKEYKELIKKIRRSDAFYSKIKKKADSGYVYKQLYPLLFKKPQLTHNLEIDNLPANAIFNRYKGDKIRSIRYLKVPVMGTSIYDTSYTESSKFIKLLNETHFYTKDEVIDGYLRIEVGQNLDPVKLSDNERIIHNLPFLEDARFIVVPVNRNTVDLILVIKDVFPFGADFKFNSFKNGSLRLFNRNIFGFGHQLSQAFVFKESAKPSFYLGQGSYTARNVRSTLTDFSLFWSNAPYNRIIGIDISKPFLTPEIKYAGGINVTYNESWLFENIADNRFRFSNRLFDTWLGYSVITNRLKNITSRRQQAAITTGFYQLDYYKIPQLSMLKLPPFISTTRFLTGINILRSEFYRTNMLYGYGKTEDIFYGHHLELVLGWEKSELISRFYSAIRLDITQKVRHAGLIGLNMQIGGYHNKGIIEDGVFKVNFDLISPLIKIGRNRIRNFGLINYTKGFNRNSYSFISINNNQTGQLFNNFDLTGHQRLIGRVESVTFTPYYFMGFRFAGFWFLEAAVISDEKQNFVSQQIYPAIGIGIRFRNENLVFSTFQFALTFYPVTPGDQPHLTVSFSDLPNYWLQENLINKPSIIEYQ